MSLVQRQGVHQLISTEKKALEKINEAKKRRLIRMKEAREEAMSEINKFRGELEAKFVKFEREYAGNRDEIAKIVEKETKDELEKMEKSVKENREAVIERLMELVCDIRPELHHNLLLQKKIFSNEKTSA
uniref:V-type proton ATPase subunit G n=1 Tax=Panagrolaimus sp. JU765 TaxID=591449 RepID=A0AC34RNI5_9BILA